MAKDSKIVAHVKSVHAYPYEDAADLEAEQLEGWHRTRHALDAEKEHEALRAK